MASAPRYLRVSDLVRDYGFTTRHWGALAAAGKIPGARQPAGKNGHWFFERRALKSYAKGAGLVAKEHLVERKPLRPSYPSDVVYAIYSAGHVKIGVSSNVTRRSYHFSTATPAPIVLLATIEGSNDLEVSIQKRLATERIKGEWFKLSASVRAFIAQMQRDGRRFDSLESAERDFRRWLRQALSWSNGGCHS